MSPIEATMRSEEFEGVKGGHELEGAQSQAYGVPPKISPWISSQRVSDSMSGEQVTTRTG